MSVEPSDLDRVMGGQCIDRIEATVDWDRVADIHARRAAASPTKPHMTYEADIDCLLAALDARQAELEQQSEDWQDAEGDLRLRLRAQAAVIARFKTGWRPSPYFPAPTNDVWLRGDAAEPMTEDEQHVLADPPVTEGADTDG